MKIIILHGDDVVALNKRLDEFKAQARHRGWDINYHSRDRSLAEIIRSESLFAKERLFIVEDIDFLGKDDLAWIRDKSKDIEATLILVSNRIVPVTIAKHFPKNVKKEEFSLPKLIFKMLDAYYPGNTGNFLKLLHECLKNNAPEMIFGLISGHIRDIYWAKVDPENIPYPDWRILKLRSKADKFDKAALRRSISELAMIDHESKTSKSNLLSSLDLFAVSQLQ